MHPGRCPVAWSLVAAIAVAGVTAAPVAAKTEFNIVPIAGGDSDVGIGIGQVSDIASLESGFNPYKWRIESGAFITFKLRNDEVISPFQDYYALLTLPQIGPGRRIRLEVRPAFTDETTLKFYGIGNATPLPVGVALIDTEYARMHPTLSVVTRLRMSPGWYAHLGSIYTHSWLEVSPSSLLAQAAAGGSEEVRALLGSEPFRAHGTEVIELGFQFDSRDDETVTGSGQYHTFKARLSPATGRWLPYAYQQLDVTLRFYATVIPRWLTLSFRLVGDALMGDPPFYELARFEETPAIGGGKALRGVPAQRYYGKVKLFENFEVRSELLPFTVFGKSMVLGAALFADAGRTWTELGHSHPALDGTGLGLKYGLGGGLRLQQGHTFVVRADIAWSPDAEPVGAYFAAGQIF